MQLPIEVWKLIFTYLRLNDLVEISWECKEFYQLCAENHFYVKKLKESKKIFKDKSQLLCLYKQLCEDFCYKLFRKLVKYVPIDNLIAARKIIHNRLHYSLLPFHVRKNLFQCCRNQFEGSMGKHKTWSTKLYLHNSKICNFIEKELIINAIDFFPVHWHNGVTNNGNVSLIVHSCVSDWQELENFGILYYKAISSPFILWTFYLDILGRIVLNNCNKLTLNLLATTLNLLCCLD